MNTEMYLNHGPPAKLVIFCAGSSWKKKLFNNATNFNYFYLSNLLGEALITVNIKKQI